MTKSNLLTFSLLVFLLSGTLLVVINNIFEFENETNCNDEFYTTNTLIDKDNKVITLYDKAEAFFNDSYVHEIHLTFNDPDWQVTLYNGHENDPEDPYFPVKFEYDNTELDVGINYKGLSSFSMSGIKKSFRIDFNYYDEDTTFFGLKKLNLNNGFKDPTMLREKIFNDFASQYVPIIRAVHTRLYIDGEYWGLYTSVEHIDKTFVESRFGPEEDGNIYRAEMQGDLTYHGDSSEDYAGRYELKTNEEENDWSDFIEFLDILNNAPESNFTENLEMVFDVKSGLYALALCNLFVSLDSYIGSAHNYYLYDRDEDGKITYLLWDANESFGSFTIGLSENETIHTLNPFWLPYLHDRHNRPLIEKLLSVDSYNKTYLRIMAQMLREGFNVDMMNDQIQELANLIRQDVYADTNKPFPNFIFEITLTDDLTGEDKPTIYGLRHFIEERYNYLEEFLNEFAEKTDFSLNELMSNNHVTFSDENGEYDPWVELYNLGPGTLQTNGLYLTDNPDIPNKWALPDQTIDDGQFLLLWIDNEISEGNNHASFELKAEGGELLLFIDQGNSEYSLIDNVTYPSLNADISYGRNTEGEDSWEEMCDHPTPTMNNEVNDIIIPTNLFINEIMASNRETIRDPDDYSDYPDWIELFNGSNETIDLSGMYLTDDITNPNAWKFSEGSTIDKNDFLVIWADSETEQGLLHTNFKISGNGEEIILLASDGKTVIDYIGFNTQISDFSLGRIPDGGSTWEIYISTPTPGEPNIYLDETTPEQTGLPIFSISTFLFVSVGISAFLTRRYRLDLTRRRKNGLYWNLVPESLRKEHGIKKFPSKNQED